MRTLLIRLLKAQNLLPVALCLLFVTLPALGKEITPTGQLGYTFSEINSRSENTPERYSGKEILWEGKLLKMVSNDAFFSYLVELEGGDTIHIYSDRGITFEVGEYISFKGFIMIKEGRFSHVVVNDVRKSVKIAEKPAEKITLEKTEDKIITDREQYQKIVSWIGYYNRGISRAKAETIANYIITYSKKYNVDPYLVTAVMSAESAFNTQAISIAGAIGLGQLMPGTAAMLGVDPYNTEQNVAGSVRYLRGMLDRWKNSKHPVNFALASYNAGPGAVERFGGIPPYRETIDYVGIVNSLYGKIVKFSAR